MRIIELQLDGAVDHSDFADAVDEMVRNAAARLLFQGILEVCKQRKLKLEILTKYLLRHHLVYIILMHANTGHVLLRGGDGSGVRSAGLS